MSTLSAVPLVARARPRRRMLAVAACSVVAAAVTTVVVAADRGGDAYLFPPVVAGASLEAIPLYEVVRSVGEGGTAGKLEPGHRLVPAASTIGANSHVIGPEPAAELRARYARLRIVGGSRPWWDLELYAPDAPALPGGPHRRLVAVFDGRAYMPMTVGGSDGTNFALVGGSSAADMLALATTLTPNVHQCGPATPPRTAPDPEWACVWAGPST
jgi:hypothetical protein